MRFGHVLHLFSTAGSDALRPAGVCRRGPARARPGPRRYGDSAGGCHGGEGERRGDIGCIVRSLGCFPSEAELRELLAKLVQEEEDEEATRFIHMEKFLPVMTKVLLDRSYWPIREDVLLHAFEALDENKCGYITKEDLVKYLTEEGEPFTEEEMEEMLSIALDPETDTLHYRDYLSKLVVDETKIFPFHV
ncbi:dynein regulatory complex protein 8 isoform X2 [Pipra filicauda]|uniref:Dynein regulatory complex protein 8 isoform X2 n=1 Tax=Pipra filicauda TaxID=649802 RepID=A0A6J2IBZ2_9PASS|nr:dynein regulatory complex protein 8 isoform X2 [Pipra filicauda]